MAQLHLGRQKFARRQRQKGTDSICLKCFTTIASSGDAGELEAQEATHNCNGPDLGRMLHPEMPKVTSR
jgi:hypothetical protein